MPLLIIQWLIAGFGMAMASLLGRLLVALGVSYVTYTGITVVSDWLFQNIIDSFGQMPLSVVNFLGWLWVDRALSMMFSAWTAAMALKVGAGGSITKMEFK
ncbi:DUF2523 family protein [uncultured Oxalicibacterium sp.]|uniref:DUF2523 family protein n=1 Tax=uncultured Oxalicibacterium sp. TaxID=1168540 RepID=UPI0025E30289|nr:DUF2523 family protein [uncultured Oxalicibacterium sp.]